MAIKVRKLPELREFGDRLQQFLLKNHQPVQGKGKEGPEKSYLSQQPLLLIILVVLDSPCHNQPLQCLLPSLHVSVYLLPERVILTIKFSKLNTKSSLKKHNNSHGTLSNINDNHNKQKNLDVTKQQK